MTWTFVGFQEKKNKNYYDNETQKSFELLMKAYISPSVTEHPNFSFQFELCYDASSFGVGAVLAEEGDLYLMCLGF